MKLTWSPDDDSVNVNELAFAHRNAPRVEWDDFLTNWFDWRAGEHVIVLGDTGSGKTTLLNELALIPEYVVALGTKPFDASLDRLIDNHDFVRYEKWPHINPDKAPRRVVWPHSMGSAEYKYRREIYREAIETAHYARGWAIMADEVRMFSGNTSPFYGLGSSIIELMTQGRSSGVTFMGGSQRPRWIPLECITESKHLFCARYEFREDLARVGEMRYNKREVINRVVPRLAEHEFLYISKKLDTALRVTAPIPD